MKAIVGKSLSMPRVYRHFAVVTVSATILLAVFADGENREAVAQVATPAPATPHTKAKPEKTPPNDESEGSFGTTGGDFGSPMITPSAGGGGRGSGGGIGPQQVAATYNPSGLPDAEWARLTPAQREEILRKLRELRSGKSEVERRAQIAKLLSSSALRSGSAPSDDD